MGERLMAVVTEGDRGRVYFPPSEQMEAAALAAVPKDVPDVELPERALGFRVQEYGFRRWGDLFTNRQLVALTTFSDLVLDVRDRCRKDAVAAGVPDDGRSINDAGTGATAYADAVASYLALAIDRASDYGSAFCSWHNGPKMQALRNTFGRHALPMVWDFAEGNPFSDSSGNWMKNVYWVVKSLELFPAEPDGITQQVDAIAQTTSNGKVISTDPPYFDNIGYADLSDFFYVWLRRSLRDVYPSLFSTLTTPKSQELIATPFRHEDREHAESFFLNGMTVAASRLSQQGHPDFPVTIYYAFKQSEAESDGGSASTGWEVFLDAVIRAGFAISGTWPMRTELGNRMISRDTNALASSVVLVCRPRHTAAAIATRRDFLQALKAELPEALRHLKRGNIAPVDLAQSAIGPGMAIYTRYAKVLDADGSALSVRDALALINQTLDEVLGEQEGEFDADTRWAVAWFDQHGFGEGAFGDADNLSRAKNTSVDGLVEAGIVQAGRGNVRLLRPDELPDRWDPVGDQRLTVWEATHHLARALDRGEQVAADLAARLGGVGDVARDLAYRLYALCERKKRAQEALTYNALVQSWPEIQRLAAESAGAPFQEQLEV
jgi:putative DNA methylase